MSSRHTAAWALRRPPGHHSATVPAGGKAGTPAARSLAARAWLVLRLGAGALTAVLALVVGLLVAGDFLGTWGMAPVLTGSMRPGIQPGDLVVVVPEPLDAVRIGQILVIKPPGLGGAAVVHRVISVAYEGGKPVIRTKGDANNVPDPWHARLGGSEAWRVRAVVPKLGFLAVAEQDPSVRTALDLGFTAAGIGIALNLIWRREGDRTSEEPGAAGTAAG